MSSSLTKERGVIYIGNAQGLPFYERLISNEFKDNKNLELRAIGKAIPTALRICEKLVNYSKY